MFIDFLKNRVLAGENITKEQALALSQGDLAPLCAAAQELRLHFMGNGFDLCAIVNGKSGHCGEDCKYCAQSAHYATNAEVYPLHPSSLTEKTAVQSAAEGVLRFAVVTAGKSLSQEDLEALCRTYKAIHQNTAISLCASHGILSYAQLLALKKAGVSRYHHNLETSQRFFPSICTTHTYEDRVATIKNAQKAGLSLCSGGIMGLGETMEDRIDLFFALRALGILSVPINILSPIPGTPLENQTVLTLDEVRRIIAVARFILPHAALRMAGGRGLLPQRGAACFQSGANAAISGDMLTTKGVGVAADLAMAKELGFEVKLL